MRVARSLEDVTSAPSVLTIGTFDGVHLGHQRLIGEVVAQARERGVRAVVLTFDPHPRAVLAPESAPPRITTIDDEAALMATLGVDALIIYPFTRETANTSAHDFMAMVARAVHPVEVWVGDDFAFGKGREGNLDVLRALGGEFGYTLNVLPRIHLDDRPDGEMIGSTNIRDAPARRGGGGCGAAARAAVCAARAGGARGGARAADWLSDRQCACCPRGAHARDRRAERRHLCDMGDDRG